MSLAPTDRPGPAPVVPARVASVRRRAAVRSLLVGAGLAALAARVGTGPIRDALAGLSASTVLIALGLGAVATATSAMRWRAVARSVGVEVPAAAAWAGIYRATLLNSVLPGGFLGDAERAVNAHQRAHHGARHGTRDEHQDPQRAARVVVLERTAGQATVFAAALAVVVATTPALLPTLVPDLTAITRAALAVTGGVLVVAVLVTVNRRVRAAISGWLGPVRRQVTALGGELRGALLRPRTAAVVIASSLSGFASLVGTFALAAQIVGVPASPSELLPLCTVGLVAMAVPVNIGGWGPRELATATAFAAAGLGAPTGLAVAVLYGVLSLIGCLPGAVVLALDARTTRSPRGSEVGQPQSRPSSRTSSLAR